MFKIDIKLYKYLKKRDSLKKLQYYVKYGKI